MRPRFQKDMAGERLILPAIYPVPDGLCDTLWHIGAEELVVHIYVEMERKAGVFWHKLIFMKKAPARNEGVLSRFL